LKAAVLPGAPDLLLSIEHADVVRARLEPRDPIRERVWEEIDALSPATHLVVVKRHAGVKLTDVEVCRARRDARVEGKRGGLLYVWRTPELIQEVPSPTGDLSRDQQRACVVLTQRDLHRSLGKAHDLLGSSPVLDVTQPELSG
jgi:hypothetical protein